MVRDRTTSSAGAAWRCCCPVLFLLLLLLLLSGGLAEGAIVRNRTPQAKPANTAETAGAAGSSRASHGATKAMPVSMPQPVDTYPTNVLSFDGDTKGARSFLDFEIPSHGTVSQFTVSAWVRIKQHKSHNMVLTSHERRTGFALFVDSGEKACLGLFRPEGMKTVSSRSLQLPFAWHYIVGTYDGNTSLVYVDGMPGDADPVPGLSFSRLSFSAGGIADMPAMRLEGSVARVQIWDHARSASQIAHDMLSSWTAPQTHHAGLLGSWPLNEGQGLVLGDKSAAGRAGKVGGDYSKLPEWTRSTIPHFATGQGSVMVQLGQYTEGGQLEIINLPSDGILELWDKFSSKPIGLVPRLPWPLVNGRQLRFVPHSDALARATEAGRPVCSSFTMRFTKDGVSTAHLVELLVGTTEAHLSHFELNKGCRQARAFLGTTAVKGSAKLPLRPAVSFLLPLTDGAIDAWRAALQSLLLQDSGEWEAVIAYPKGLEGAAEEIRAASQKNGLTDARIRAFRMPEDFATVPQLVNQAATLAVAEWLMPMSSRMRLSPGFVTDVASQLAANINPSQYTAIAPVAVSGKPGISLPCPAEGSLPPPGSECVPGGEDEEDDCSREPEGEAPGSGDGGGAVCSCQGATSVALAKAGAEALAMGEHWPLLLPGGLVPAALWHQAGGWEKSVPLDVYSWDFWLKVQQSATAPPPLVLRAGELSLVDEGTEFTGQCTWDGAAWGGSVDGVPALDSVVALLRLKHRAAFWEESLAESEELLARMVPGMLPAVDAEVTVHAIAANLTAPSRSPSAARTPIATRKVGVQVNQQT